MLISFDPQEYFICDWWFNVDCSQARNFFIIESSFSPPLSSFFIIFHTQASELYSKAEQLIIGAQASQVYQGARENNHDDDHDDDDGCGGGGHDDDHDDDDDHDHDDDSGGGGREAN